MKRYAAACGVLGHDVRHAGTLLGGERVYCVRPGCGLDVPKPDGQRCLAGAYRVWAGPQGLLEGVDRGET